MSEIVENVFEFLSRIIFGFYNYPLSLLLKPRGDNKIHDTHHVPFYNVW